MHSHAPHIVGKFQLNCSELLFVQYMPIKLANGDQKFEIPQNLQFCQELINKIEHDTDDYVYLTVKNLFVTPDNMGNRPGWHIDGFGTNDVNYIWSDSAPTEFCIQEFSLSQDHELSMDQMSQQASERNIRTYGTHNLIKLDSTMVHRVPVHTISGFRVFIKISVSKDKYNLKGNAHNYLLDYNWHMYDRSVERNHPQVK